MSWFTIDQFIEDGCGGRVLPSTCAVRWAIRQHYRDLIGAGVVLPGAGRRPTLVRPELTEIYAELLAEKAAATVAVGKMMECN